MTHIEIGLIVDNRYEIRAFLGAGGMACVYSAIDSELHREVAIKFVLGALNDEAVSRCHREALALSKLCHRNVVRVYSYGVWRGHPYLVMELLPGSTLDQVLRSETTIELQEALQVASQIAVGLGTIHDHGIVHRDLKPSNVLVRDDGTVKIFDFGLCKVDTKTDQNLTQEGTAVGSLHYMSPEQCTGRSADERSDIYSFGIVLFEMIAGTVPFTGHSAAEILSKHLNEPTPLLQERYPLLRQAWKLDPLISQCLSKEPEKRFRNGHDLAAAIDDLRSSLIVRESDPRNPIQSRWKCPTIVAITLLLCLVWAAVIFSCKPTGRPASARLAVPGISDPSDSVARLGDPRDRHTIENLLGESCLLIDTVATLRDKNTADADLKRKSYVEQATALLDLGEKTLQNSTDPELKVKLARLYKARGWLNYYNNRYDVAEHYFLQAITLAKQNCSRSEYLSFLVEIKGVLEDRSMAEQYIKKWAQAVGDDRAQNGPMTDRCCVYVLIEYAQALLDRGNLEDGTAALERAETVLSSSNLRDSDLAKQLSRLKLQYKQHAVKT